jgi:ring-1,2-phenylacetyl-CoA epoxidase subunit PaaC
MSNLAMAHATAISAREFQDMPAPARYMLHLGDNALILAQRLGEWGGHGPILEEDISLTNTALDLLGQARLLYTRVGELHAKGLSEDDYAYWRNEFVFFNWTLCELPNAPLAAGTVAQDRDYAITVVRNALYSALMLHMWQALQHSVDPQLAGIAAKSVKETRYTGSTHACGWSVLVTALTSHTPKLKTHWCRCCPTCKSVSTTMPWIKNAHTTV